MKVITICGSLRFELEMKCYAERLELEGHCVLSVIYPTKNKNLYTNEQWSLFELTHKKKIDLSDAIFVVNKGGYIGNSTRGEIDYAIANGKEVIYLEPLI